MLHAVRIFLKGLATLVLLLLFAYGALVLLTHPSNDRDWSPDQSVLPHASIDGNRITITNIRNAAYRSTTDYDVSYYDKVFDLNELESAWYLVEPFGGALEGAGHTLVSFGFSDGSYVALSVEIRKEKGESFSPLKGVLRQYELMYVIADERDVIGLRTNYRHDDAYLYPLELTKAQKQQMFLSMLNRANEVATKPEFYNTLTNTCATNIVAPLNEVIPNPIGWSYKITLPTYSDELLHDAGLIDPAQPLEALRQKYRINERAMEFKDDPLFSQKIRQ